jgi:hypothetical protein
MRILAVAMMFAAVSVYAEPRPKSPEECMMFADLALVVSTLAKHGIEQTKAAAMIPDMYQLESENAREIARQVLTAAYQAIPGEPKHFAAAFGARCLSFRGSIGSVGVRG